MSPRPIPPVAATAALASAFAVPLAVALAVGAALAGCHHEADERLGLDDRKARPPWDVRALGAAGELEKALAVSSADVARRLGPHRLAQTAKLQLTSGERKDLLKESWRLEVDKRGSAHLVHDTSHDAGFETWIVDGQVYVRPQYGRYVKRPPEGDEIERARDAHERVLASWLAVLGRFAARKDQGAVTVLGRAAHKVALSLAPSPGVFKDSDPTHAWRKGLRVSALSGEVVVDDASGAPLSAALEATYSAPRPVDPDADTATKAAPGEVQVTLSYHAAVEELGTLATLMAPTDFASGVARPRPLLDKQVLLEGLVAPGSSNRR